MSQRTALQKILSRMKFLVPIFLIILTLLSASSVEAIPIPTICYVDSDASGSKTGESWENAYSTVLGLRTALGNSDCDQIWVAEGVYLGGLSRIDSIQLRNGLAIYGGFNGTETVLSEQNPALYVTTISGNVGDFSVPTDNLYRVINGSNTDNTAVLDGFVVSNGYADVSPYTSGAGMYINNGSPTIRNVTFKDNYASGPGGGLYSYLGSPSLNNVIFNNNDANNGGGIYNSNSDMTVINGVFIGNSASSSGGAIYNYESSPTFNHLTVTLNSADTYGRGIFNDFSSAAVRNSIVWGNPSRPGDSAIYDSDSTSTVEDSVIAGGFSNDNSDNIITEDPILGTLGFYGGRMEVIPILEGSSAIDNGNGSTCAHGDQRGLTRSSQGAGCDIGAFEHQFIQYASPGGREWGLCQSWAQACELRYALKIAHAGQQIWVEQGSYTPTVDSDRAISFQLISGVELYGGFAGTEDFLSDRGDWESNKTVLSGNIGAFDLLDNSFHVVNASGVDQSAVLDGFFIREGRADGTGQREDRGGGIYISQGGPIIRNVAIERNFAAGFGGGVHVFDGSPSFDTVSFKSNDSDLGGGGLNNVSGTISITNSFFFGNDSQDIGGAIRNSTTSQITVTETEFESNSSGTAGGGIWNGNGSEASFDGTLFYRNQADNGGAIYNEYLLTIDNSTFDENTAKNAGAIRHGAGLIIIEGSTLESNNATEDRGGAIYVDAGAQLAMKNSTVSTNYAKFEGGAIYSTGKLVLVESTFAYNVGIFSSGIDNSGGDLYLRNTIITYSDEGSDCTSSGGTVTGIHNLIQSTIYACGLTNGVDGNLIGVNPKLSPLNNYGGPTKTHRLASDSPALDKGMYTTQQLFLFDQRGPGYPRVFGASVDIGAYEYSYHACYVNNDGLIYSSADAKAIQNAVDEASEGDLLKVAGDCAGIQVQNQVTQTLYLKSNVSIQGGYSQHDWSVSDPINNPTTLRAFNAGRVVYIPGRITAHLENLHIKDGSGSTGGGIFNLGTATLNNLMIFDNESLEAGGGIQNDSVITITNSTIFRNTSGSGGGLFNNGREMTILNSTISTNKAVGEGGGLVNKESNLTMVHVSMSHNDAPVAGGLLNTGSVLMHNSLIANSINGGDCIDSGRSFKAHANLIESEIYSCGLTHGVDANIIGSDPSLADLDHNGAATLTHALLSTSRAIDAVPYDRQKNTCGGIENTDDQRGVSRPKISHCDIGAYEYTEDDIAPIVSVHTPNGGEVILEGSTYTITWTALDDVGVTHVNLHFENFPGNWISIAFGEANDGTYTWQVPNLSNSTRRNTRVRVTAFDASLNSGWDTSDEEFVIEEPPPGPFNKLSPEDGDSITGLEPTLSWEPSEGAHGYQYCYFDTSIYEDCNSWNYLGLVTSVQLPALEEGKTYMWQVKAFNAYEVSYANGSLTAYWQFTVRAPGAFNKLSPDDTSIESKTALSLSWEASSAADSYEYCYDTTNDGACSTWLPTYSTSAPLNGLVEGQTYFWHVRAKNTYGTTYSNGDSQNYWSFTFGTPPPGSHEIFLPITIR